MKEIVPSPPPIVRNDVASRSGIVPAKRRAQLWALRPRVQPRLGQLSSTTSTGKRYLDLGGGIAVSALGHAHPAITEALVEQSRKLVHISNLYYHEPQGRLAQALVNLIGAGQSLFLQQRRRGERRLVQARAQVRP